MKYNKLWKHHCIFSCWPFFCLFCLFNKKKGRVSLLWRAPAPWVSVVVTLAGGWTYPSSASIRAGEGGDPSLGSVGFAVVLGALQLDLQPLHPNLETVHGLNGSLRRHRIVVTDEPWEQSRGGLDARWPRARHTSKMCFYLLPAKRVFSLNIKHFIKVKLVNGPNLYRRNFNFFTFYKYVTKVQSNAKTFF